MQLVACVMQPSRKRHVRMPMNKVDEVVAVPAVSLPQPQAEHAAKIHGEEQAGVEQVPQIPEQLVRGPALRMLLTSPNGLAAGVRAVASGAAGWDRGRGGTPAIDMA